MADNIRRIKIFRRARVILPLALTAATLPIISMQVSSGSSTHSTIAFDGKTFARMDDVIKYLIDTHDLSIEDQKVIGDLGNSYSNFDVGTLNKKLLPDYDPTQIHMVYFTAAGTPTDSYDDAVRTYFNPASIVKRYTDSFGNIFDTLEDAKASMDRQVTRPYVGFYDKVPMFDDKGSIFESGRINPLNSLDVKNYTANIKDNVVTILADTMKGDLRGGYSVALDENAMSAAAKNALDSPVGIDFSKILNDSLKQYVNDNQDIAKGFAATSDGITLKSAVQSVDLPWKSPGTFYLDTNDMSANGWKGGFISFGVRHDSASSGDQIRIHVDATTGDRGGWFDHDYYASVEFANQMTGDHRDIDLGALTLADLLKFINLSNLSYSGFNNMDGLLAVPNNERLSQANIDSTFGKFNQGIDGAVANAWNAWPQNYVAKSAPVFMRHNQALADDFVARMQVVKPSAVMASSDEDMRYESVFTSNTISSESSNDVAYSHSGMIGENNNLQIGHMNKDIFHVSKIEKFSYSDLAVDAVYQATDASLKRLLNALWSWNDTAKSVPVLIKKDGHPIFAASLGYDDQKGIVVKAGTWRNVSADDLGTDATNLLRILNIDGLGGTANKPSDEIITQIATALGIDANKPLNDPKLEGSYTFAEALKQYVFWLRKVYDDSDKAIRGNVAKRSPQTDDDVLCLGDKTPVHMGHYRYLGPMWLNPALGKDTNLVGDLLATNAATDAALAANQAKAVPAQINVAFDTNGEIINLGEYFYDTEAMIRENILNTYTPRRDYDHVYIDGSMVKNTVFTIKHVILHGHDYYFDKYENFYNFIVDYITDHSESDD